MIIIMMIIITSNPNNDDNNRNNNNNNKGVCEKTLLRRRIHVKLLASKTPNQGLESSFCCWTAGQGLVQKECLFHRHQYYH